MPGPLLVASVRRHAAIEALSSHVSFGSSRAYFDSRRETGNMCVQSVHHCHESPLEGMGMIIHSFRIVHTEGKVSDDRRFATSLRPAPMRS